MLLVFRGQRKWRDHVSEFDRWHHSSDRREGPVRRHQVAVGGIGQRRERMLLHLDPPLIGLSVVEQIGTAVAAYGQDHWGIENVAADWIRKFAIEALVLSKNSRGLASAENEGVVRDFVHAVSLAQVIERTASVWS